MTTKNSKAAAATYEAFNKGDLAADAYAADCVLVDHPRGLSLKGRDEAVNWTKEWMIAFPDGRIHLDRLIDGGDTIVAQLHFSGTNTGTMGNIPATGKHVSIDGCEIFTFDNKGKIAKDETYYDAMSMLAQLGLVQPPE